MFFSVFFLPFFFYSLPHLHLLLSLLSFFLPHSSSFSLSYFLTMLLRFTVIFCLPLWFSSNFLASNNPSNIYLSYLLFLFPLLRLPFFLSPTFTRLILKAWDPSLFFPTSISTILVLPLFSLSILFAIIRYLRFSLLLPPTFLVLPLSSISLSSIPFSSIHRPFLHPFTSIHRSPTSALAHSSSTLSSPPSIHPTPPTLHPPSPPRVVSSFSLIFCS